MNDEFESLLKYKLQNNKTELIILPSVFYGCKTWSLTLREEHRLGVFENRRIFGPNREKMAEDWRQMNNQQFHNFYS
jgi:hypothetical protein